MRSSMAARSANRPNRPALYRPVAQQAGTHVPHETALVEAIVAAAPGGARRLPDRAGWKPRTRRGSSGPAGSPNSPASFKATLPPSEKPTRNTGAAAFLAKFAQYGQQVAGEAGVIERAAQALRTAAGAHVEAVGGESGAQRGGAQAAHVAGFPGAFQTVDQDDLAGRRPAGRCDSTSTSLSGSVRYKRRSTGRGNARARPEMARDGLPMRIPEQRLKRGHRGSGTCSIRECQLCVPLLRFC